MVTAVASVDVRTRSSRDLRRVDPQGFFADELPALMADRADVAVPGAREMELRPIALVVDGDTWVLAFDGDRFSVDRAGEPPAEAATVAGLDAQQVEDVVNDVRTPVGFLAGGDLDVRAGRFEALLDWSVVLRSLIDGRPIHTPGAVTFADPDGGPLDLARSFTLDDDPAEVAHHLAEAGCLHLQGVFGEDEMAAVSTEMDAAASHYTPGDGNSWWARTHAGDERLVRMQTFHEVSPTTARLLQDDRLLGLARLTDDGHRLGKPGGNQSLVEALVKPIGIVEGISDVPWHKDCSLGGHSYRCCSLTVGISVTGADAASGQLRVVPGSHRTLTWPSFVRPGFDLEPMDLPTQTGDVTVHLSCTLHMSQPPVSAERRVMYTDFFLPTDEDEHSAVEAAIRRVREAAPTTVNQPKGHVADGAS
jgi:hypothetical protein